MTKLEEEKRHLELLLEHAKDPAERRKIQDALRDLRLEIAMEQIQKRKHAN